MLILSVVVLNNHVMKLLSCNTEKSRQTKYR